MKRTSWVSLAFCMLAAAPFYAQNTNVTGHASLYTVNCPPQLPYCYNFSNGNVKICAADAAGRPSNNCSTTLTNNGGYFSFAVGPGDYFFYFWYDGDPYYGSPDYPTFRDTSVPAYPGNETYEVSVPPRTFPPRAIVPQPGQVNVQAPAVTLEWSAGIDDDWRKNPGWPLTFDIYASGNEFPELKVLTDVGCPMAWTDNKCTFPITNLQWETRYQWRIVAKLKSSLPVSGAGVDSSYTQSSLTYRFSTGWNPATPFYNIIAANGSYFRAPGGGGGTLSANGSTSTYETQFKLQDNNGGTLNAGDPVCIYTNRSYYFTAPSGTGTVSANQQSCGAYETFAYEPVSGGVAFRSTWSNLYMSATNGGGGSITVGASTVGPNETFKLQ